MKKILIIVGTLIIFFVFYFGNANTPSSEEIKVRKEKSKEEPQVHNGAEQVPDIIPKKIHTTFKKQPPSQKIAFVKKQHVETEEDAEPKIERPDDMVYATTPEGIDDAMKAFLSNIRTCYQVARKNDPEMEGRITFAFQISKNNDPNNSDIAKISDVEVLDTEVDSEEVENCIMDNLDELWFDPPEGEPVQVRYPFLFSF